MSGAIRDGRWSKSLNCCLWRGNSVPLSLTRAPTAPQYRGDKGRWPLGMPCRSSAAHFPCPMSHVPCSWCSHMGQPSSPKLSPKPSPPFLSSKPSPPFLCPKPCRAGMALGDPCWLRGTGWDRQLQTPPVQAQLCPIPAPPSDSSDPTGATEGRLKPGLGTAWLMASEALDMNCQHCATASHCSHPLQEGKRAAESLNCC